jgi:hypothetical protein
LLSLREHNSSSGVWLTFANVHYIVKQHEVTSSRSFLHSVLNSNVAQASASQLVHIQFYDSTTVVELTTQSKEKCKGKLINLACLSLVQISFSFYCYTCFAGEIYPLQISRFPSVTKPSSRKFKHGVPRHRWSAPRSAHLIDYQLTLEMLQANIKSSLLT